MSDDFAKNGQGVIKRKKVAHSGAKTAKQAHKMRKVRVSLYFGRSFDKNGTAPLYICVNHASSSCYIPMQGVRLKSSQWDKARKKVVNHPQADTINYTRRKTGRLYSVKVEGCAKSLIKAHRGKNYLLDILQHYKSIHVATSQINKQLKSIASDLELPPISTYTARYSWATLAQSIDTPIEVISQALGHSYGMAVTLGYIVPDRRKVDEANQKVLALL